MRTPGLGAGAVPGTKAATIEAGCGKAAIEVGQVIPGEKGIGCRSSSGLDAGAGGGRIAAADAPGTAFCAVERMCAIAITTKLNAASGSCSASGSARDMFSIFSNCATCASSVQVGEGGRRSVRGAVGTLVTDLEGGAVPAAKSATGEAGCSEATAHAKGSAIAVGQVLPSGNGIGCFSRGDPTAEAEPVETAAEETRSAS
jgi:hypothetical protein